MAIVDDVFERRKNSKLYALYLMTNITMLTSLFWKNVPGCCRSEKGPKICLFV
jgi:hypothetical protein